MKINSQTCKRILEKNFDFPQTLWDRGDITIKEMLKVGIDKFVTRHTKEITDIFAQIRKEFDVKNDITEKEIQDLQTIKNMNQT